MMTKVVCVLYYIALELSFEYTTNCYAKQTIFGTPRLSGCYDFLRSPTTHCYP